ncbi:MAG: hypothetical protein ACKO14_10520 [Armatimonadota bacterium]
MSELLPAILTRQVSNAGVVATPQPDVDAWIGSDIHTGRPVMVRRIPSSDTLQNRLTAALDAAHQTVVPFRRWMLVDGSVYTIRDVLKGKNLRQYWMGVGGRADTETLRRWIVPLLDGLAAFHTAGIAHGGLSLDNLIIGDDLRMYIADGGICDPSAPHHNNVYGPGAGPSADIVAATKLVTALLPKSGPFASPVVRARVEGLVLRCETLAAIRELLEGLDEIAMDSITKAGGQPSVGDLRSGLPGARVEKGHPQLVCDQPDRCTIVSGSGGELNLLIRNTGQATLLIRVVATQHPWLNVRQIPLPIVVAPNGTGRIPFVVSAARLAPGDYRSQVFLSTNAPGGQAENLASGWYRHTAAVTARIISAGYR